ncbi:MAG: succinyl-diaminopimelate desuccinylase, partial [Alphaproteobacteria bacterium]
MKIDPIKLAQELIKFNSVTPANEDIVNYIISILEPLGFVCKKYIFNNVANLYARYGTKDPNFCFAGHTDVVPTGDLTKWSTDPFGGIIQNDILYGRGAVDMKGAIASFISAAAKFIEENDEFSNSISLLLTGDEEESSKDGMIPLLEELKKEHEELSFCLVGEPTNPSFMGEMIKIGRRGSINFELTVNGTQGHVAYPEYADNPIPKLMKILNIISEHKFDEGNEFFDKSNLEVTSIDVGNTATNIIPNSVKAKFNIRFNNIHSASSLTEFINITTSKISSNHQLKIISSSESFLCKNNELIEIVENAVKNVVKCDPILSTSGGTSDARFIKDYCPVIEFGLINKTAHKADENIN